MRTILAKILVDECIRELARGLTMTALVSSLLPVEHSVDDEQAVQDARTSHMLDKTLLGEFQQSTIRVLPYLVVKYFYFDGSRVTCGIDSQAELP